MNNKTNYDVNFQFDFDEDEERKKFSDGRIKRAMIAHEGEFISDFSDYGSKDMFFKIYCNNETLKTIIDSVLKDADRCETRMTVSVKQTFDLIVMNLSDVENKEQLMHKIEEDKEKISYRRLTISLDNPNELCIELQALANKDTALTYTHSLLDEFKVKDILLDKNSIEVMQFDNYKTKKRTSFDY